MRRLLIAGIAISLIYQISSAAPTIRLTIQTDSQEVAAIGLTYNGHKAGALGRHYSSSGFQPGLMYQFGYRKSMFGKNYACGSEVLDKDSIINLKLTAGGCKPDIKN